MQAGDRDQTLEKSDGGEGGYDRNRECGIPPERLQRVQKGMSGGRFAVRMRAFGIAEMRASVGQEGVPRFDRQCALRAFKVMKLEIAGIFGREFAEEVTFRGVRLLCVEVIQIKASSWVVTYRAGTFLTACRESFGAFRLHHNAPKTVAGAVQQNPEVTAIDLKLSANDVFVFFIEADAAQKLPVLFGHLAQNLTHQFAALRGNGLALRPVPRILGFRRVLGKLALARMLTQEFERNVVTDGMHEARQTGGIIQRFTGMKVAEDAKERFLISILRQFRGAETGTKLQLNGPREVGDQEVFGIGIPHCQRAQIVLVE